LALLSGSMFVTAKAAQVIVYQETFETDGEGTRWTSIGRGVSEDPASGPAFWGLNYGPEAPSFVGVRAIAPARRAAMAWHHSIPTEVISTTFLDVFECVANWMSAGRPTVVLFSPPPAGPGDDALKTRLEAAGYTIVNDDTSVPPPAAATIGLVIQSSSGVPDPTRFTAYAAPLLSYNASNHDDELTRPSARQRRRIPA
jgi:hypothetical protein